MDLKLGSMVWLKAEAPNDKTKQKREILLPAEVIKHEGEAVMFRVVDGEEIQKPMAACLTGEVALMDESSVKGVEDMATLGDLHVDAILHNIRLRMKELKIYSYVGSILVALNPYKRIPGMYGPEVMQCYARQRLGELPPHVYAIANEAFVSLMQKDTNQCVLISGESGAGKSENTKLILSFLAAMSGEASLVEEQVQDSSPILEALGNAKTVYNNNSSRFGKFIEIQYNRNGNIKGAKITDFLLEKSRVAKQNKDERNYHIFYNLIAGCPSELKDELAMPTCETFHYLTQSGCTVANGIDDLHDWNVLVKALNTMQFSADQQLSMWKTLAGILHLGNVKFTNRGGARAENMESITQAAALLGLDPPALEKGLTTKTMTLRGEVVESNLSVDQGEDARDSLAMTIYSRLFQWVLQRINSVIQSREERYIGVLDIFGFENFAINSFEQFCINFANEKLAQYFNNHIFFLEQTEYTKEGINWSKVDFKDNQACIDLIEKKLGLLSLLDEESKFPKGTDQSMLEKFHRSYEKHECYIKPRLTKTDFGVRHYAGEVVYESTNFLVKNRDTFKEDLVDVLRSSKSALVSSLFEQDEVPPEDQSATGGRGRGGANSSNGGGGAAKATIGTQFKNSLSKLLYTLACASPHFVRCIKPNMEKVPDKFLPQVVTNQLLYSGMLETVRIRRAGYPIRHEFSNFVQRYRVLNIKTTYTDPKDKCRSMLKTVKDDEGGLWQIGNQKVFLKEALDLQLEKARQGSLRGAMTVVRRVILAMAENRLFQRKKVAAGVLRKFVICFLFRLHIQRYIEKRRRQKRAVLLVQSRYRGHRARVLRKLLAEQKRIMKERKRREEEERRRREEEERLKELARQEEMRRQEAERREKEVAEMRRKEEEERIRREEEERKRKEEEEIAVRKAKALAEEQEKKRKAAEHKKMTEAMEGLRRQQAEEARAKAEREAKERLEVEMRAIQEQKAQDLQAQREKEEAEQRAEEQKAAEAAQRITQITASIQEQQATVASAASARDAFDDTDQTDGEETSHASETSSELGSVPSSSNVSTADENEEIDVTSLFAEGFLRMEMEEGKYRRRWFRLKSGQLSHYGMQMKANYIRTGWLNIKRSGTFSAWKRRWFIVRGHNLFEFHNDSAKSTPVAATNIDKATFQEWGDKKHPHAVKVVDSEEGKYDLEFDSESDRRQWLDVCKALKAVASGKVFELAEEIEATADPSNIIEYKDIMTAGPTHDPDRPEFSFAIASKSKVIQVAAESKKEMDLWISILMAGRRSAAQERGGQLLIQRQSVSARRQRRWCVLEDMALVAYNSPESSKRVGTIPLDRQCSLYLDPDGTNRKMLLLGSQRGLFYLTAVSEVDAERWYQILVSTLDACPKIDSAFETVVTNFNDDDCTNIATREDIVHAFPIIRHQADRLSKPLLRVPYFGPDTTDLHALAIQCFNLILGPHQDAKGIDALHVLLSHAVTYPPLRSEVTAQVAKQLIAHPDPTGPDAVRLRRWLLVLSFCYQPNKLIARFAELVSQHSVDTSAEFRQTARRTWQALTRTRPHVPLTYPPSRGEVVALYESTSMKIAVNRLDGRSLELEIDPSCTAEEVLQMAKTAVGLTKEAIHVYGLYENFKGKGLRHIDGRMPLAYIFGKWETMAAAGIDTSQWRLQLRVRCFSSLTRDSPMEVENAFVYYQVHDMLVRGWMPYLDNTPLLLAAYRMQYDQGHWTPEFDWKTVPHGIISVLLPQNIIDRFGGHQTGSVGSTRFHRPVSLGSLGSHSSDNVADLIRAASDTESADESDLERKPGPVGLLKSLSIRRDRSMSRPIKPSIPSSPLLRNGSIRNPPRELSTSTPELIPDRPSDPHPLASHRMSRLGSSSSGGINLELKRENSEKGDSSIVKRGSISRMLSISKKRPPIPSHGSSSNLAAGASTLISQAEAIGAEIDRRWKEMGTISRKNIVSEAMAIYRRHPCYGAHMVDVERFEGTELQRLWLSVDVEGLTVRHRGGTAILQKYKFEDILGFELPAQNVLEVKLKERKAIFRTEQDENIDLSKLMQAYMEIDPRH